MPHCCDEGERLRTDAEAARVVFCAADASAAAAGVAYRAARAAYAAHLATHAPSPL